MGSSVEVAPYSWSHLLPSVTMMDLSFLQPIINLLEDEDVKEKIDSTARLYFNSEDAVTVNLLPAIIILGLASLFLLPLFGIPILGILGSALGSLTGGGGQDGYGTQYGYGSRTGTDQSYYDQTIADLQNQVASLQENPGYYNSLGEGAQDYNSIAYTS